jgi:hypothetical protein
VPDRYTLPIVFTARVVDRHQHSSSVLPHAIRSSLLSYTVYCVIVLLSVTAIHNSPVVYNAEESFCSLNFASRVRTVELGKASRHSEDRPSISTSSNSGNVNSSSSASSSSGAAAGTRATSPMSVANSSFSSTGNSPMQPKPLRKR